jgi:hypothetical protein
MTPQELQQQIMRGLVPLMSFAPVLSTPDITVVEKLRSIIGTGLILQKQIASEKTALGELNPLK